MNYVQQWRFETFSISHEQSKLTLKLSSTMYERLNNQVKFLTSQYIGTCKSAYTKGYALNWVLTGYLYNTLILDII